ncbi:hypothetical protein PV04_06384 [Phialophora macrospora]|uniref:Uncharacterized protein n=1 Tax=Phialophora macrospora TaxID=1851006 RepID=A0A0D2CPM5_9EURO|nr:hypothetical protein PV04_06384 [Phialophora macrospora]
MGLPMFREPEEVAADEAAAKLDKIAATGRSTIRRESTTRPGRSSSSRSLIDRIRESRRDAPQGVNNSSRPSRDANLQNGSELAAHLGWVRRQRQRARVLRDREIARRVGADYIRPEPETRSDLDVEILSRLRTDPGSAALDELHPDFTSDILSPNTQESISQHLPRPSRESGLRFEVGATSQSDSDHPRPPQMLASTQVRSSSPSGARRARWSYRPAFADPEDEENENDYRSGSESLRPERIPVDGPITSPPSERQVASYPPLRRVNHFSPPRWEPPGSRFDGLGDRIRSPGPANDEPVEENWANLLDTIEPGRSSTATSFMSTRSDSRNGSNRSSQATTMTTSFGEIGGDDTCDLDLPSGITEEDVREIRARHGRLRRELGPDALEPDDFMRGRLERSLSRGNEHGRLLELEIFGVILDRMEMREEIPDEWLAAVGLSPDVVRGNA